ncbi:hypothetical protein F4778DRAFT_581111 [Xylariomycetidae sp. FL2044]|nr:hypothetical protein F4778DRAFT_581111 [Xylariomycetidae sp. FL2044]
MIIDIGRYYPLFCLRYAILSFVISLPIRSLRPPPPLSTGNACALIACLLPLLSMFLCRCCVY